MQKLEIHPNAAASFNEKAKDLLLKLQAPAPRPARPGTFRPDLPIAHHLGKDDIIGTPTMSLVDHAGKEIARYFQHNGRSLGLHGDGYADAMKLTESFQKCKELAPLLSHGFMVDRLFEWLEKKHKDSSAPALVDFVLSESPSHIAKTEIWIPISGLHVQSPLTIGRIILKPITKEMFDAWVATATSKVSPHTDKVLELLAREREQLQSLAAATIEVNAEPERAQEIAFEEAEASINALRFFEAVNREPEMVSYCGPFGHRRPAFRKHLTIHDGALGTIPQRLTENSEDWTLSDEKIANLNSGGLQILSELIARDGQLSEFEERLLAALMIYSRNGLERLPNGKLIHILSALESFLLKNSTEGIEQNLGERMAFVIATDVSGRKAVISNIKEIYGLRSKFLHHGVTIDNLAAMRVFMHNAWVFLHTMIHNVKKVKTMDGLYTSIERIKLS